MAKVLTLSLRCSPKMLTEHLSQQQLYIRLTAKVLKLFMSLSTLVKMLNLPASLSTLNTLAETRMDKGSRYDAHVSTLGEHLSQPGGVGRKSDPLSRKTAPYSLFAKKGNSVGGVK